MEIIAIAIMFVGGIWGGIYLITSGHPWFGALVLFITASLRDCLRTRQEGRGRANLLDDQITTRLPDRSE